MSTLKERALAAKAERDAVNAAAVEARRVAEIAAAAEACRIWFIALGVAPNEIEITGQHGHSRQVAKFVLEGDYRGTWCSDGRYFEAGCSRQKIGPTASLGWHYRGSYDSAKFRTIAELAVAMTKADSAKRKPDFSWL